MFMIGIEHLKEVQQERKEFEEFKDELLGVFSNMSSDEIISTIDSLNMSSDYDVEPVSFDELILNMKKKMN